MTIDFHSFQNLDVQSFPLFAVFPWRRVRVYLFFPVCVGRGDSYPIVRSHDNDTQVFIVFLSYSIHILLPEVPTKIGTCNIVQTC